MSVKAPLAMRYMKWDWENNYLVSPSFPMPWARPVVWADCKAHRCSYVEPPYDPEEFPEWPARTLEPDWECSCGIYATTKRRIAEYYNEEDEAFTWFLCEPLGEYLIYTAGWRAAGAQIIAVIDHVEDQSQAGIKLAHLTQAKASQLFQVPIIGFEVAQAMIAESWSRYAASEPQM